MTYEKDTRMMGFGDPKNLRHPIGWVTLREFVKETPNLELWQVEYDDRPGKCYELWVKKNSNGTGK
jgi:hypothetical protein